MGLGVAGEGGLELGRHPRADAGLVDLSQELGRLLLLCERGGGERLAWSIYDYASVLPDNLFWISSILVTQSGLRYSLELM